MRNVPLRTQAGQTQICIDKKIQSYPTWIFADGSQLNGEIPLQQLADKTSVVFCQNNYL